MDSACCGRDAGVVPRGKQVRGRHKEKKWKDTKSSGEESESACRPIARCGAYNECSTGDGIDAKNTVGQLNKEHVLFCPL